MSDADFIAGDWGISRLRLSLCDASGNILDRRDGPGVTAVAGGFAECLRPLLGGWPGELPILFCGMVGSNLGWKEVPYITAPASAADIAHGRAAFDFDGRRVFILPGVRAQSWSGAPDVMRGEETQIVGAIETHPALGEGDHLVCLPGTHAKWVELSDGRICRLTTALSGELFALLSEHGTLCDGAPSWDGAPDAAFRRGLERAASDASLLHLLFETRARRLTGDLAVQDARAFLSGLIVGSDVRVLRTFALWRVVLVGSEKLNALYAEALAQQGIEAQCLDGERQSVAGLHACRLLWRDSD